MDRGFKLCTSITYLSLVEFKCLFKANVKCFLKLHVTWPISEILLLYIITRFDWYIQTEVQKMEIFHLISPYTPRLRPVFSEFITTIYVSISAAEFLGHLGYSGDLKVSSYVIRCPLTSTGPIFNYQFGM